MRSKQNNMTNLIVLLGLFVFVVADESSTNILIKYSNLLSDNSCDFPPKNGLFKISRNSMNLSAVSRGLETELPVKDDSNVLQNKKVVALEECKTTYERGCLKCDICRTIFENSFKVCRNPDTVLNKSYLDPANVLKYFSENAKKFDVCKQFQRFAPIIKEKFNLEWFELELTGRGRCNYHCKTNPRRRPLCITLYLILRAQIQPQNSAQVNGSGKVRAGFDLVKSNSTTNKTLENKSDTSNKLGNLVNKVSALIREGSNAISTASQNSSLKDLKADKQNDRANMTTNKIKSNQALNNKDGKLYKTDQDLAEGMKRKSELVTGTNQSKTATKGNTTRDESQSKTKDEKINKSTPKDTSSGADKMSDKTQKDRTPTKDDNDNTLKKDDKSQKEKSNEKKKTSGDDNNDKSPDDQDKNDNSQKDKISTKNEDKDKSIGDKNKSKANEDDKKTTSIPTTIVKSQKDKSSDNKKTAGEVDSDNSKKDQSDDKNKISTKDKDKLIVKDSDKSKASDGDQSTTAKPSTKNAGPIKKNKLDEDNKKKSGSLNDENKQRFDDDKNKKLDRLFPKSDDSKAMHGIGDEVEPGSSGHFIGYFMVMIIIIIVGYVMFHNKQKIIGFIVEGKSAPRSRRSSGTEYKRLPQGGVDEVLTIPPGSEKSSQNYIY